MKLKLNINKEDPSVNDFVYCWNKFNSRPNKIFISQEYLTNQLQEYFKEYKLENTFTEILYEDNKYVINDKVLIKISDDIYISFVILDKKSDKSNSIDLSFFYKKNEDIIYIQNIINEIYGFSSLEEREKSESGVSTITYRDGYFNLVTLNNDISIDNIELFYSRETMKSINKLIKKIKKNKRGISILHGDTGTGKTSIINYISSKLKKKVIYITNNIIEQTINNIEFENFIKDNQDSVLVIDDSEFLFSNPYSKSNISNNIVQLIDDFLSNNLNIITIFNSERTDELDENILECNNLLDCICFKYLSKSESNELSNHLGHKTEYKGKNRLIDIIKDTNMPKNKKIGLE
jgi:uncharacterized protein YlbG (UPF0298 family)